MTVPDFQTQEDSQLHQEIHELMTKRDGQIAEWMVDHYKDHVRLHQIAWVILFFTAIAAAGARC